MCHCFEHRVSLCLPLLLNQGAPSNNTGSQQLLYLLRRRSFPFVTLAAHWQDIPTQAARQEHVRVPTQHLSAPQSTPLVSMGETRR